jgi:heat shock protein HtpX
MRVNPASEPLYIVNPLQANARGRGGGGGFAKLFSTHPPMEERVARLRRMAGASSLQLQRF